MNYLFFLLMQVVTFPLRLFAAPTEGLKSTWSESGRSRSMLMGIPALLISILGMAAIGYAQYGNVESLEKNYLTKFETSGAERSQVLDEVAKEARQQRQLADGQVEVSEELKQQVLEIENQQLVYLNKLISIAPENAKYRFNLAQLWLRQGNQGRAMAIFESIAPEDRPGFADAHFWMANHYTLKRARTRIEMLGNTEIALKHIDHGLARDPDRRDAKAMKATLLRRKQNEAQAYAILEELFLDEPSLYRALLDINKNLGRTERDNLILDQALTKFSERLRTKEVEENDQVWVQTWIGLVACKLQLKQFQDSEVLLQDEIRKYSQRDDGGPRRVFLEQSLSGLYFAWAQDEGGAVENIGSMTAEEQFEIVDFFAKAHKYNLRNGLVLQGLARLSVSRFPEVAEAARKIYDPEKHVDAPAVVLNQLGTQALLSRNYKKAIESYERAREKEPNNSPILNNLAYAYLVSEEQNPSRALQLVNEAIRYLPDNQRKPETLTRYWHTKGTALMQLDRLNEAIGEFERAIQARPKNIEILQSLIQCYKGSDLPPPGYYMRTLEEQMEVEARAQSGLGGNETGVQQDIEFGKRNQ